MNPAPEALNFVKTEKDRNRSHFLPQLEILYAHPDPGKQSNRHPWAVENDARISELRPTCHLEPYMRYNWIKFPLFSLNSTSVYPSLFKLSSEPPLSTLFTATSTCAEYLPSVVTIILKSFSTSDISSSSLLPSP